MATFARIDKNNIVKSIHEVDDEHLLNEEGKEEEVFGIVYLNNILGVGFTWIQTSYTGVFRKNYGRVGDTYDETRDAFISPKPYPSWTLNEDSCQWEPSEARPDDRKDYKWNEDNETWDLAEDSGDPPVIDEKDKRS